jgi:hypothetical protein
VRKQLGLQGWFLEGWARPESLRVLRHTQSTGVNREPSPYSEPLRNHIVSAPEDLRDQVRQPDLHPPARRKALPGLDTFPLFFYAIA